MDLALCKVSSCPSHIYVYTQAGTYTDYFMHAEVNCSKNTNDYKTSVWILLRQEKAHLI